jgi:predicted site-specific integrase-resolvase
MSPGELLTFTDVCEHLGITTHTLKKAIRLGQIPTVIIGDREYVTKSALERCLLERGR